MRPSPTFAARFAGSTDLYQADGRRPFASINFMTAHDGFTLATSSPTTRSTTRPTREDNRDGTDDNRSWNCGAEGPTDDPEILALRARQQRNLLATLLLSQGVPMLLGGDEFGRTPGRATTTRGARTTALLVRLGARRVAAAAARVHARLIALRREHPVFRRRTSSPGASRSGSGLPDVWWFRADGGRMTQRDWADRSTGALGVFLNGDEITEPRATGNRSRRLVPAALQRPSRGRRDATAEPELRAEWALELSTSTPRCSRERSCSPLARTCRWPRGR